MAKRSTLPHVQVSVDQEFQLEWATGHDRNVYFVLIAAADVEQLGKHNSRANGPLETYLAEAPQQLLDPTQMPMLCPHCKYHRTRRPADALHALGGTVASHYAMEVSSGPYYRDRPAELGSSRSQWAYRASPNDRHVSYASSKYPWIKAVWRYEIQEGDASEWDFALFKISSALGGPGDYIMHYLWSGYYDCIDINVVNATLSGGADVAYPYGKIPEANALVSNRVDHCLFDTPTYYISVPRAIYGGLEDAARGCVRNCADSYERGGCNGVSVFPLSLILKDWGPHWDTSDNLVKTFWDTAWAINQLWNQDQFGFLNGNEHYPWDRLFANGTVDIFSGIWRIYEWIGSPPQFTWTGYNQTTLDTLRDVVESHSGADPWACVLITSRAPTTTVDKYTIVDDPLDPVWYSTCYEVVEQKEFLGLSTARQPTLEVNHLYRASLKSGCISCEDALTWQNDAYTPVWTIQDKCVRCERETNVKAVFAAYPRIRVKQVHFNVDQTAAAQDASCVLPPEFKNFRDYCLLPHLWTHPLLADGRANTANWPWWSLEGIGNLSTLTTQVGFQRTDQMEWTTESLAVCAHIINRDPLCSRNAEFVDTHDMGYQVSEGCQCVREDPCCLRHYQIVTITQPGRYVFDTRAPATEPDPDLDPTCTSSHGLLSGDGRRCCRVVNADDCGGAGCTTVEYTGWAFRSGGAMCRGYQIPDDRCCRDWAPPCTMCP